MKRLLYPVLLICISVLTFNCQKEISGEGTPNPGTPTVPVLVTMTVQGKIVNENGQPAAGVNVQAGNKTAVTDAKGYFRIVKTTLDKNAALVTAEKTGYFKAYRTFVATSGASHVSIKLIKKQLAGTITVSSGGDITLVNGAKISFPANGIVKALGGAYAGTVNVYSAYIDPTSADIGQTVPGSFIADDKNNKRVTLTSYGMMAVELESTSGEKLQVANGKTATLTTPIPSSMLSNAPASISLWYVDEQTGIWKEEGTAVKNGNNYVGEVKHFSFWNCDFGVPAVLLSMTLKTPAGVPLVHVWVRLTRPNGWGSYGMTDSLGQVGGLVPINEVLQMDVMDDCFNSVHTQNIGPFTGQTVNLGTITVTAPASGMVTITGNIVNCTGLPVANGTALIDYDYPRYVTANASGQFSISVLRCGNSPTTCAITGIDNVAQQQGTVTGIAIVSPVTNAGNIAACGVSTTEYINYTVDGTNYNILSTVAGDSLYASAFSQGTTNSYITGYNISASKNMAFTFQSPSQTAGTYPINYVATQNLNASILLSPSEVNVTTFPAASGGFFEGNFSGSFKDSANLTLTHTFNGNFRVRRH